MPNKRYLKGRYFEYRVKEYLSKKGYLVFRLAGSKPIDLIAYKDHKLYLIECKYNPKSIDKKTISKLQEYKQKYPEIEILIAYSINGTIHIKNLRQYI